VRRTTTHDFYERSFCFSARTISTDLNRPRGSRFLKCHGELSFLRTKYIMYEALNESKVNVELVMFFFFSN